MLFFRERRRGGKQYAVWTWRDQWAAVWWSVSLTTRRVARGRKLPEFGSPECPVRRYDSSIMSCRSTGRGAESVWVATVVLPGTRGHPGELWTLARELAIPRASDKLCDATAITGGANHIVQTRGRGKHDIGTALALTKHITARIRFR